MRVHAQCSWWRKRFVGDGARRWRWRARARRRHRPYSVLRRDAPDSAGVSAAARLVHNNRCVVLGTFYAPQWFIYSFDNFLVAYLFVSHNCVIIVHLVFFFFFLNTRVYHSLVTGRRNQRLLVLPTDLPITYQSASSIPRYKLLFALKPGTHSTR